MSLGRNHAVQTIMQFADFATFLHMRFVCKQWWLWSRESIQHWYNWLCMYGPRDKWELIDHYRLDCNFFDRCRNSSHFREVRRPPKLLKTMPLCDQVFKVGAEHMCKRTQRDYNNYYIRVADLERQLQVARQMYAHCTKQYHASEAAAEKLLERLATRKRRRISKPA
jgi:hypothetical protein